MPGIEMSMTTTSGFSASAFCTAVLPSLASDDHFHVGLAVDEQLQPVTHRHVIVGEQNAQRRGAFRHDRPAARPAPRAAIRTRTVVPLPGDDSISRLAPTSAGALLHADQAEPVPPAPALPPDRTRRRRPRRSAARWSARRSRMISTLVARACLATLVSASCAMR